MGCHILYVQLYSGVKLTQLRGRSSHRKRKPADRRINTTDRMQRQEIQEWPHLWRTEILAFPSQAGIVTVLSPTFVLYIAYCYFYWLLQHCVYCRLGKTKDGHALKSIKKKTTNEVMYIITYYNLIKL